MVKLRRWMSYLGLVFDTTSGILGNVTRTRLREPTAPSPGGVTLRTPDSSFGGWGILSSTWSTTPPGPRPLRPRVGMWPIRTHIDPLSRNLHFP